VRAHACRGSGGAVPEDDHAAEHTVGRAGHRGYDEP
jgi:hypothetical protein